MGKKGSGKKKGKKGKKGKKKGKGEPQISWEEALLAYKINILEKQKEDVMYELRALQEKNERHKERNERLMLEQGEYIKMLLKQARDFDEKLLNEEVTEKAEVIKVMKIKWEATRQEEKDVTDLKEVIARTAAAIALKEKDVEYWSEYKNKGQFEHKTQIELLQQELADMEATNKEMAAHLERTATSEMQVIEASTEEELAKQKELAVEVAMAKMDKYSRREVLDNEWLNKEVDIHRAELEKLVLDVEEVETGNLEMMSELFECQVDDLKITRNLFLTQFEDSENLDEHTILEMDLSAVKSGQSEQEVRKRPKSAIQKAVEDKVLSIEAPSKMDRLQQEEEEESLFDGQRSELDSEHGDPFDNYLQFEDDDFEDYLQLGPLELKLLSISGQKKPIFKPRTPLAEEVRVKDFKPDEWPVTQPMLQQTLNTPRK